MKIKEYPNLKEKIYYEKLDNGLRVYLIPKNNFNKTYAVFATKYGSIDNKFVPYGENEYVTMPLGIAHFLEHKLFEMEDGVDAGVLLSNLGAQANAFTDYSKTAYLFSATSKVDECLNILLDFVQKPYFTDENVAKEQGIIDQELKMYLDVPREVLQLGLLKNMFKHHYINEDIGGTVDSIKEITKENLYTVYETFYHPSNMVLVIVGNINPEETLELIKNNQNKKEFKKPLEIKREYLCEDHLVYKKYGQTKMDILIPKVAIGLKLPFQNYQKDELLKFELMLKILLEETFGPSSDNYQEMLDKELINNTFSYNVFVDQTAGFIIISTDTLNDEEFVKYIQKKLISLNKIKMSKESFNKYRKVILGNFLKSLNYLDYIANSFVHYILKNNDSFKTIEIVEGLNYKDLKTLEKYFKEEAISVYKVLPQNINKE